MSKDYNERTNKSLATEDPDAQVEPAPSIFFYGKKHNKPLLPIGTLPGALDPVAAKPTPMLLRCDGGRIMPRGHVSLLAAEGGTGKSMLTLQLAASVATGQPWLCHKESKEGGFYPCSGKPGRVLLWSAEDDWQIANNRWTRIAGVRGLDTELIKSNIVGIFDKSAPLASVDDGGIAETPDYDGLCRLIRAYAFDLVIIDSLALIAPGDVEKDNALAHRFIREYLARAAKESDTPPAMVVTHHTTKPSGREHPDQHSIRGASGIVNGAREALLLTPLEKRYVTIGTKRDVPLALIRLAHVKANLSAKIPDRYLRWRYGDPPILCTATKDVVKSYFDAKEVRGKGGATSREPQQQSKAGGVGSCVPD